MEFVKMITKRFLIHGFPTDLKLKKKYCDHKSVEQYFWEKQNHPKTKHNLQWMSKTK